MRPAGRRRLRRRRLRHKIGGLAGGLGRTSRTARPGQNEIVFILAYTLFGAMAVSLKRAWMLLQPARSSDNKPGMVATPSPYLPWAAE